MISMQQMFFIFCVLPGSIAMGSDWTTEMCNSGMCFNGEAECRESCDRLCRQQRAQGFCYFDNFLSRVFICWCSFNQSKSLPTTTETTTTTAAAATEVSTILSVLTRTDRRATDLQLHEINLQDCMRLTSKMTSTSKIA
uniref:Uncharacterized protein LOC111131559 isoform X2 n=1 Tax=Crassostrea virginica TaxID=6565 RepID=A0A8B8E2U3_CRAVI|nr:uncharacterized protein LOC111131559 isoform X2 [Crassostrea virginica]